MRGEPNLAERPLLREDDLGIEHCRSQTDGHKEMGAEKRSDEVNTAKWTNRRETWAVVGAKWTKRGVPREEFRKFVDNPFLVGHHGMCGAYTQTPQDGVGEGCDTRDYGVHALVFEVASRPHRAG